MKLFFTKCLFAMTRLKMINLKFMPEDMLYSVLFELGMSVRIAAHRIGVFAKVPYRVNEVRLSLVSFEDATIADAMRKAFSFMLWQDPCRNWNVFSREYSLRPITDSPTYRRYVAKYTSCFCQDCIHDLGGVGNENAETPDCWRCCGLVINDDTCEDYSERYES